MRWSWWSSRIQACSVKKLLFLFEFSFLSPPLNNMFPTHSQSVVSWPNFYGGASYKSPRLFTIFASRDKSSSSHERDNDERPFLSLFFFVSSHSCIPLTSSHWNSFAPCSRMATDASTDLQCSETVVNRMLVRLTLVRIYSRIFYYFWHVESFGDSPEK